jgi:N-acetylglutamate synthase
MGAADIWALPDARIWARRDAQNGAVLEACDVGHRVVVRRYVGHGPQGRPLLTDVIGHLVAIDEERLVVRAHDGVEHTVSRADVAAAKRIPPRRAKHSEIAALELVADAAWPAPVHERLGDWILRAADGWTGRANTALPLGDPGRPLTEAIDAVEAWYARRDLYPAINVPLPLRRDVGDALTERGWHPSPPTLVQTARLADVVAGARGESRRPTQLLAIPSEEFLSVAAARKRSLPPAARQVLTAAAQVRFAEVREEDGALLAMARGAAIGDWLHLGLVEVAESQRRRGLARQVSQALAGWASESGATRAMLQVEEHNGAALALYAGLGFGTHHHYLTFRAPPSSI